LLAALLVACGNDGEAMRDAGDGDSSVMVDADIDADPNVRGTVTVRIVDKNDAPIAGMYVVFIDTDSTVTERMTDSAGMAQADVYPNATVTAVRQRSLSYSIATVQALNPGDVITLISASPNVSSSEDPFSQRVVPWPGADIAQTPNGATKSGTTATYTTVAPHGLTAGDRVVVANVSVLGYNGEWTVASVPSPTTFTANIGAGTLANSGTLAIGATATKAYAFSVNYPAYAGAQNYQVRTRCGAIDVGTLTSATLVLPSGCAAEPQDILVLAQTNAGAMLAWNVLLNTTITAGGSATAGNTWYGPSDMTVAYMSPTPEVNRVDSARYSPYGRGTPISQVMQAMPGTIVLPKTTGLTHSSLVSTFTCPEGTGPACLSTQTGAATQRLTEKIVPAVQHSVTIAAELLPWVKAAYVPATQTLDIAVTGSGSYDLFEANLRYFRTVGADQHIFTWRVFGPFAQSVKFPTLPATAPGNPTIVASDTQSTFQAFVCESDAINGYRAAIKNPFVSLGTCEASTNTNVRLYDGTKNRVSQWN
jgi:hypothetical protein